MKLNTSFDGLRLENPLMPASGPLVGDVEKLEFMQRAGCGGVVTKTISSKLPHIPRPCIYGDREFVMNSELWSEHAYATWVEEILPAYQKIKDRPLFVSVGYTKEDMDLLIPLLDPFADAFEISTHYVGKDLSVIAETVKTIRKHTKKPLYMKISPHISDPVAFAKAVEAEGANGIVAINSLGPTLKIDLATRKIVFGNETGFVWMSGPSIKPIALAIIHKIKSAMPHFTVIGVGGIKSADDMLEFLLAGASAVQMLSAALLKGKGLYEKIIKDLPKTLEKYGFSSIEDVIAAKLTIDASYEPFLPVLIPQKCTRCMICLNICPYFAIDMKDQITFNPEKCFSCGLCIVKCPVEAITR